jgi:penicillin-binding protein 1A
MPAPSLADPVAGLLGLVAAGFAAVRGGDRAVGGLPEPAGHRSLTDYRPKLPMRVFSADGVLIGEFGEERRNFVPIAEIPKVMQQAVLAIEDARFYEHRGVDYIGVCAPASRNVNEARSQGASTITMQVARNFYLSDREDASRARSTRSCWR